MRVRHPDPAAFLPLKTEVALLLMALEARALHGYAMIKDVRRRSDSAGTTSKPARSTGISVACSTTRSSSKSNAPLAKRAKTNAGAITA